MIFLFVKLLLLLTVFFIPLIGATGFLGFEQIKILFFILSTSLVGFIWVLSKPKLEWNLVKIASGVFILSLFLTSGLGINIQAGLLGNVPYFQGWIIYAYLWLFSIIVASSGIKFSHWSLVIVASAILVSFFAIKDWILINIFAVQIPTYAGRVVSSFGQPNFLAGFLLLTLPFSYYLFKDTNRKLSYVGGVSALMSFAGIFVSFSRSTILMALLLFILGLIGELKIKFKIGLIVLGVILVSIIVGLWFSSGIVGNEISKPFLTKNPDLTRESVEKRAYIWPVAWQLIKQKPLTGYGLENIAQSFSNYFETNKHKIFEENLNISPVLISLKELNIDRSHNYILDLLLFSGGIGLLAWVILIGILFWKQSQSQDKRKKGVLFVALIIYLIWIQFQNQSIVNLVYFWLLMGLIY